MLPMYVRVPWGIDNAYSLTSERLPSKHAGVNPFTLSLCLNVSFLMRPIENSSHSLIPSAHIVSL
jgi:hypothetical protein